ncbi:hypothetical protein DFH08DRAFT_717812 [Mycena albidolilacea]|uniref:DUF4218 domain-containing protein n=1 Tax=Mycena albidolilacea TaxID=1033008 RepID=A0AAD6Z9A0_9AGAR|nr:hypothetical protein DFH08DRAFT_717812 [Mycena albidolilacea]
MHLIPENIIKNLLSLWTGDFKGLDEGTGEYQLQSAVIEQVGNACNIAGDTTPAAFGARVPNLATQQHYFTAESYTLFTTLLGPVVLRDRFAKPTYYKHFLELVSIFNDCLKLTIDRDYVDVELRKRIAKWVQDFEKYYYQYNPARLSVCTLTLHAMLHIPDDILNAGPMWCYWNYVTERFVGYLVRSSKSRKNPYASFARRLREIAQNNLIKVKYQLYRELDLSDRREEESRGHTIASYPDICVLRPHAHGPLAPPVLKAVKNYLLRTFEVSADEVSGCIPADVSHWGKISFMDGGDKIRAAELVMHSEQNMTRDASFIKYSRGVDLNRNHRHMPVLLQRQPAYGQLLRIIEFVANLPTIHHDQGHPVQQARTVWLAIVRPVKILAKSKCLGIPYYQDNSFVPIEAIDVDDISCLVSRIPDHKPGPRRWALCERQDAMGAAEEQPESI